VRPEPLSTCFLVNIPLAGSTEVRTASSVVHSNPRRGWVLSPLEQVEMRWSQTSCQLIVQLDRGALERQLERLLGRLPREPLRFEAALDLAAAPTQSWLRFVAAARTELERGGSAPLAAAQLEELLACGLLLSQPSNYSAELGVEQRPAPSRVVRRALEFLAAHTHEPITLSDIAQASGTGPRALQLAFRRELGRSPMRYLTDLRLERVRADLRASDGTVTEIAVRWGFAHLGRFAAAYRDRYGLAPSADRAACHS